MLFQRKKSRAKLFQFLNSKRNLYKNLMWISVLAVVRFKLSVHIYYVIQGKQNFCTILLLHTKSSLHKYRSLPCETGPFQSEPTF
jgi:hypothetical protein